MLAKHIYLQNDDKQTRYPHKFVYAPEWISLDSLWVFLKSEKCGRGGKSERKKVEKGGKERESAVFNEG